MLEHLSAGAGLLGALLLATKSGHAPWAWAIWLISNIGWIIFGLKQGHFGLVAQNTGFLITSALGCWTWIVQPRLASKRQPRQMNMNQADMKSCNPVQAVEHAYR